MDPQISYSTIDLLFGISTSLYSWTLGGQLYQGKSAYNFDVEQTIQKISLQEKIFIQKWELKSTLGLWTSTQLSWHLLTLNPLSNIIMNVYLSWK